MSLNIHGNKCWKDRETEVNSSGVYKRIVGFKSRERRVGVPVMKG